ncbi:hypothetical protein CQW23_27696 [Capsicum baccatum]|uniref:Uncharacterized protein n=1 Tax=Capsicum baccatum TaxID=33114 RepID=A0A2G2VEK3_CAPBA|nr:hypothetical protein CQW23_27696 [Capsicum baccatum]
MLIAKQVYLHLKRSKRNSRKSDIGSLDIPTPDKMNDASDVGCETSNGKKLVENEDNMTTEADSKTLEVALERCQ